MAKKKRRQRQPEHIHPAVLPRSYQPVARTAAEVASPETATAESAAAEPARQPDTRELVGKPIRLSSAPRLFVMSLRLVRANLKTFAKILAVYMVLQLILVRGLNSGVSVNDISDSVNEKFGDSSSLTKAVATFTAYVSSSDTGISQTSSMQPILFVISSLATIWTLRKVLAGKAVSVKQAFYRGPAPIVPFILLLLLMLIQLLPFLIGGTILTKAVLTGVAIGGIEKGILLVIFLLTASWSLYLITASLFGLFIVSLPEESPLHAYRAAKDLVAGRRLQLVRKILFLPIILLISLAVILIPLILVAKILVEPIYDLFNIAAIIIAYIYFFTLYKELLGE